MNDTRNQWEQIRLQLDDLIDRLLASYQPPQRFLTDSGHELYIPSHPWHGSVPDLSSDPESMSLPSTIPVQDLVEELNSYAGVTKDALRSRRLEALSSQYLHDPLQVDYCPVCGSARIRPIE